MLEETMYYNIYYNFLSYIYSSALKSRPWKLSPSNFHIENDIFYLPLDPCDSIPQIHRATNQISVIKPTKMSQEKLNAKASIGDGDKPIESDAKLTKSVGKKLLTSTRLMALINQLYDQKKQLCMSVKEQRKKLHEYMNSHIQDSDESQDEDEVEEDDSDSDIDSDCDSEYDSDSDSYSDESEVSSDEEDSDSESSEEGKGPPIASLLL